VDDFGHPYYEGAGRYLSELVGRRLGARVRYEKPGSIQRSLAETVSRTDALEAEMAGRAAVMYAEGGATDVMVTLEREPGDVYACRTGAAPLEEVAGGVKTLPSSMYDPASSMPTADFAAYAEPLIGGPLPKLERLDLPRGD
jgi:6-phosphofructokinase 1